MDRSSQEVGKLEASLLQVISDHNHNSVKLRERNKKAKREAIRAATNVSNLLMQAVNGGVQEAFVNQKRIEMESRALTTTVVQYGKQIDQWLAASHAINTAVKEIGDFENWMKIMEFDCKSITAAIYNIHQA